ncbi:hypothetical protein B0T10DRAFT_499150 [Thelonectria olida]|uniref:Uncharacterized protein n=1 Tax=Thelonectria olida TaxID=1576542 RepID=A0A9P8VRD3_9HYPO|nr:hypothetical protein B0T10DRAFT_499150 [Thelonectria olida]
MLECPVPGAIRNSRGLDFWTWTGLVSPLVLGFSTCASLARPKNEMSLKPWSQIVLLSPKSLRRPLSSIQPPFLDLKPR